MPGYRFDEMTETWVAVTAGRRGLPVDPRVGAFATEGVPDTRACPFCPGHESETEGTVDAVLDAHGAWRVRVVRNRFPMVSPEAVLAHPAPGGRELAGRGVAEVIVEAREHDAELPDYSREHAAAVLRMYRDRLRALEAEPGARAVSVFKNHGRRAGSSQSHPHAQVVAIGVLPHALEHRHAVALRHAERTGRTLIEDLTARELEAGARVVEAGDGFVAFCPFASHRVYETWVVPRVQSPSFGGLSDALLEPFADAVVRAVARVRAVTRGAAYNLVVRTPPVDRWSDGAAGWHLEVLPRTGGDAGFELGTGMDVVPVAPEDAAEELRGVGV